ncbi:MAG: GTPase [Phycisphaerae bacterium]
MKTFAAVMTGKGTGAIATIRLFGPAAEDILKQIFTAASGKSFGFVSGKIFLGTITSDANIIDEVIVGCETKDNFTISCHGNPLIVSDILRLLEQKGAAAVSYEQMLVQIYSHQPSTNTISIEARLAISKAATLDGTKILFNQIEGGLTETLQNWQKITAPDSIDKINSEAKTILQASKTARFLIYGCKIVLAGPPNSGKSTLFNCLAGKEKAIAADIKGTTRDWVSAKCQIGKLSAELFDTAGIDKSFCTGGTVEQQAQEKAYEILNQADLMLLVLDVTEQKPLITEEFLEKLKKKSVLTALNKCDLSAKFDKNILPLFLRERIIEISSKNNTGIENLIAQIQKISGIERFDSMQAVCFTKRQENLLQKISESESDKTILAAIAELLNGQASV